VAAGSMEYGRLESAKRSRRQESGQGSRKTVARKESH